MTLHLLDLGTRNLPLDAERRIDVCAFSSLIDTCMASDRDNPGRAAVRTLSWLVDANRATTTDAPGGGLYLTLFGIRAHAAPPASAETLLRAWQHAARDRLAQEVGR